MNPDMIALLTDMYNDFLDSQGIQEPEPTTDEKAPIHYDGIDHLNIVMTAKKMFKEIRPQLESSDFYILVVNGQPGSGKSTLSRELAHYAHLDGYQPIHLSGYELLQSQDRLKTELRGKDKAVVILDDLSYILASVSAKEGNKVKSFYTLIRHALTNADAETTTKVLLIVNAHFSTAVPPVFKNSNVWLFTKPTTLEQETMVKIIGRNKKAREKLDALFRSVVEIQSLATKQESITLKLQGERYVYVWGSKDNPGNGRIMMMLLNGHPIIYNSHNDYCEVCKSIASPVRVNAEHYKMHTKPDEKAKEDAEKRGTQ